MPLEDASVEVAASALAINFVPDRVQALREMQRVTKPGGLVSFYVWDYPGGGMGFMRAFWNAAIALDPKAEELAEGRRFPFCTPDGLTALAAEAGWGAATVDKIEIEARFGSFEDLWQPFTLGAGPAPGYCVNLPEDKRAALKQRLMDDVGGPGPVSFAGAGLGCEGAGLSSKYHRQLGSVPPPPSWGKVGWGLFSPPNTEPSGSSAPTLTLPRLGGGDTSERGCVWSDPSSGRGNESGVPAAGTR